ncbi:hypothetical protein Tco_0119716 [Tanacetum coccineum]
MLSSSDSTFSGDGDDEGDLVSKDKMIWCEEVQQKGRPELGAPPPPRPSQHHHHRCHHQMTHDHNFLIRQQDGQLDPPQGLPYPLPDWSQQCSLVIGL